MDISTIFDIVSITAIIIYSVKGYKKGFAQGILGIAGVLVAFYFAKEYSRPLGEFINDNILHMDMGVSLASVVGSVGILLAIWIIVMLLGGSIGRTIRAKKLGLVNKIFGFLLGGFKVVLFFTFIVLLLRSFPFAKDHIDNTFKNAITYPYLRDIGSWAVEKIQQNKSVSTEGSKI